MSVQEDYQSKLISQEEAVDLIKSGDDIFVSTACQMPNSFLHGLAGRYQELEDVEVISSFPLEPFKFLTDPEVSKKIHFTGFFMGPLDRKIYPQGNISTLSMNFSNIKEAIIDVLHPNVYVGSVSSMDENGYFNLGPMGVSTGRYCVDQSDLVILQVNDQIPRVAGEDNQVHISEVDHLFELSTPMLPLPEPKAGDVDEEIAKHIVPLVKDGSTIQVGFGGLSGAVSYGLRDKKNLSAHTEMITDSMKYLQEVGALTGSIKGGFAFGSPELYEWTGSCDQVEVGPVGVINQPFEIAKYDDFVSINACLMVDLTGQVVSEGSGHSILSSIGGASDFVRGAGASKGGQSFICVASTRENPKTGEVESNIVFEFPAGTPISVLRSDVMYIVTEYGIADLYNCSMEERAEAMISIAHPDFRDQLREQAIAAKILR